MEVRGTKRTQEIQRSVEIDVEIAVSVLEDSATPSAQRDE